MRIQTTMIRKGGSHVELDGATYHFAPQEDGRHIAVIKNAKHITTLLRIDGYQLLDEDVGEGDDTVANGPVEPPKAVVLPPAADDPADLEDPDQDEDGVTSELIDDEPVDGQAATSTVPADISEPDLDALFVKELNRAPHPNTKRENKIAKIEEARAMRAAAGA